VSTEVWSSFVVLNVYTESCIHGNVVQFILQNVCVDFPCKTTLEKRSDETVKNDVAPQIYWVPVLEFTLCRFVRIPFRPRMWVEGVIYFVTSELNFDSE
jgi:hypothetical protein